MIIGLSALVTYYEAFLKLLEVVKGCVEPWKPFHDWFNHFTFWPSVLANLCLLGMNAYVLHKYIDTEGFNSSGVSFIFNVLSFGFAVPTYVLFSSFCGHGPLFRVIYERFSSSDHKV